MVKIQIDLDDPTLLAADEILEKRENSKPRRGYLGMSAGGNCARQNYYNFRGVQSKPFSAKTLKNFASGHRAEPVMIKRIQQVQGLDVLSVDPATGKQFEVEDFDAHQNLPLQIVSLSLGQRLKRQDPALAEYV